MKENSHSYQRLWEVTVEWGVRVKGKKLGKTVFMMKMNFLKNSRKKGFYHHMKKLYSEYNNFFKRHFRKKWNNRRYLTLGY